MPNALEKKIARWSADDDTKYIRIRQQLHFLQKQLFHDYEPTLGPHLQFIDRFNKWLDNIEDEEEQKILYELIPYIFYVGKHELDVLYREAYNTIFLRWLIDQINIDIVESNNEKKINTAVHSTWFCPLTDSFRINQFYHINNIPTQQDYRPDWRSLAKFGNPQLIRSYIEETKIERIVLLEDFVGNGGQISKALLFSIKELHDIPILVIPLIMCPEGIINAKKFMQENKNITISEVMNISNSAFITEKSIKGEPELFKKVRDLIVKYYEQIAGEPYTAYNDNPPYSPFGYKQTGGLIVTSVNTPNNTLPIVHHLTQEWFPLFLRHKRI